MADLLLDWCSFDAAQYAVRRWHYSECMPSGQTVKIGVWEDDAFIGVVIYSHGANRNIAKEFDAAQNEVVELTRIALDDHQTPVSRIISISLSLLQEQCPGITTVVSYADPEQGHDGTVYQASNWYYIGTSRPQREIWVGDERYHKRVVSARYGTASIAALDERLSVDVSASKKLYKYKYVYPLAEDVRPALEVRSKPYP